MPAREVNTNPQSFYSVSSLIKYYYFVFNVAALLSFGKLVKC